MNKIIDWIKKLFERITTQKEAKCVNCVFGTMAIEFHGSEKKRSFSCKVKDTIIKNPLLYSCEKFK